MNRHLIYKILGVDEAQAERVILMLIKGFFMGIFLATFTVASETLFLGQFDEQKDLPVAFLVSGVLGLIATYLFNYFQSRIPYLMLILFFLASFAITTIAITIGFYFAPDARPVIFFAFVCMGPFAAIMLLIFWGTFGRIFDLREAKKIIGNIDTGTLVASIIALFSIPLILRILPKTYDLYIISAVSVVIVLITLMIISSKYKLSGGGKQNTTGKTNRYSYKKLLVNPYTKLMVFFVIVSMICVAFIDFSFLNVTSQQFPVEKDLASFLAYFEGTVVIFSFLFQTFATDRIIAMYGLKTSLLINPILFGFLTVAALLIGLIVGFTSAAANFVIFFLIISMIKLFLDSLKDALDGPSFKLYFLPISSNIKFDVQTKVEGVINVFAGLIAGGLILIISKIEIFNLLTLIFLLLPLIMAWYFVTKKMHGKYKDTLQDTLEKNRARRELGTDADFSTDKILLDQVEKASPKKKLFLLDLMEKIEPVLFESYIVKYKESEDPDLSEYSRKKLSEMEWDVNEKFQELMKNEDFVSETKRLAIQAVRSIESTEALSLDPRQLSRLAKSPDPQVREFVARLLRKNMTDENQFILLELLRDVHHKVKITAINTTRIRKPEDSWPILVDLLGTSAYCHYASAALVSMGPGVIPYLDKAFHKSGQQYVVMLRILQIYGKIGGPRAMNALWDKIDYPDKTMLAYIMNAFRYNNYQVSEERKSKIRTLLENSLRITLWNQAAVEEISDVQHNQYLREALKEEIRQNFDRVYLLLGLLYDPYSVNLVRRNIESETAEGYAFGLELLDIFIGQEIKPMLFPVLDDISINEKLNALQDYFPRERFTEFEALKHIVNRNYNQINRWAKACAIYSLEHLKHLEVSNTILAQLFNPDPLLREISAWLIYSRNREAYYGVGKRLKREVRKELDDILLNAKFLDQVTQEMPLRFEKVLFLKELDIFKNISGEILADLVDLIQIERFKSGEFVFGAISKMDQDLFIVMEGKIIVEGDKGFYQDLGKGNIFGEFLIDKTRKEEYNAFVLEDTRIFSVEKGKLYDLLARSDDLTKQFIRNWEEVFEKETTTT